MDGKLAVKSTQALKVNTPESKKNVGAIKKIAPNLTLKLQKTVTRFENIWRNELKFRN